MGEPLTRVQSQRAVRRQFEDVALPVRHTEFCQSRPSRTWRLQHRAIRGAQTACFGAINSITRVKHEEEETAGFAQKTPSNPHSVPHPAGTDNGSELKSDDAGSCGRKTACRFVAALGEERLWGLKVRSGGRSTFSREISSCAISVGGYSHRIHAHGKVQSIANAVLLRLRH